MKRRDVHEWFDANRGFHSAAEVVAAFGLEWDEAKAFRNKICSLACTGHLAVEEGRPKRYAYLKALTPFDEHVRRAVEASAAKRRLPDDVRQEREREWRREWMERPGVRERVREMQREARIRNGRHKGGTRVKLTPEERVERTRLREIARAARRAEARLAREASKPPKPVKPPKPAKRAASPTDLARPPKRARVKVARQRVKVPRPVRQAITVAVEQKGVPKVALAVREVFPDSSAFIAANPDRYEVLPGIGEARFKPQAEGFVAEKNRTRAHNAKERRRA